jgi:hypothetical protein
VNQASRGRAHSADRTRRCSSAARYEIILFDGAQCPLETLVRLARHVREDRVVRDAGKLERVRRLDRGVANGRVQGDRAGGKTPKPFQVLIAR